MSEDTPRCNNCGAEVGEANFCQSCGAAQTPRPDPLRAPETGRIPTPGVNVPPPRAQGTPGSGPGVWTGVKVFFGGCIVLPILLVLGVVACTMIVGSLNGGGSP